MSKKLLSAKRMLWGQEFFDAAKIGKEERFLEKISSQVDTSLDADDANLTQLETI